MTEFYSAQNLGRYKHETVSYFIVSMAGVLETRNAFYYLS